MSVLVQKKKIKVIMNNKEIQCLTCLDTGVYWDEDKQDYINCNHDQIIIKEEDNVEEIDTD